MSEVFSWDPSAANNNSAPPNGWPEGMQYSSVNNSAREMMASIARTDRDTNGTLVTTGSGLNYALAPNRTIASYATGLTFRFQANHSSTGLNLLNVSALGNKAIIDTAGSTSTALTSGRTYFVFYNGTDFVLSIGDDSTLRSDLANPDIGDSLVAIKRTLTNALATTLHVWLEQTVVNVKSDFGAVGDGATLDTVAFNRARLSLESTGGTLYIPAGTYIIGDDVALAYHNNNILIRGAGRGATVLKMTNSAALPTLVGYTGTGYFRIENLTIDGNRANNGLSTSGYCLYLSGKYCGVFNCEIRFSNFAGIFIGNIAGDPQMYEICFNHIHDNGGIVSGGDGVGLFGGGSDPVYDLKIIGNRFSDNYCIDTLPGDSTAINALATSVLCTNNYFLNNYNVNGGQVAFSSDVTDGATDGQIIFSNNVIEQTGTFGGDLTCGFELLASNYVVSGNVLKNIKVDGIRIEGSASRGVISDNAITCQTGSGGACINLIASGGTGMAQTDIHHNLLLDGDQGISMQPGPGNVFLTDNYIDSGIATPITSADNFKVIRGNDGYSPVNQTVSAGGSPWTSDIKNFDCQVILTTVNGISALTLGGVNLTITANTNFFLKARKQFVATWSGSAPVFNFIAQQ